MLRVPRLLRVATFVMMFLIAVFSGIVCEAQTTDKIPKFGSTPPNLIDSTIVEKSNGNIIIGTGSDSGAKLRLDIASDGEIFHQFNSWTQILGIGDYAPDYFHGTYNRNFFFGTNDDHPLWLMTNSAVRIGVLGNGNVGVARAAFKAPQLRHDMIAAGDQGLPV